MPLQHLIRGLNSLASHSHIDFIVYVISVFFCVKLWQQCRRLLCVLGQQLGKSQDAAFARVFGVFFPWALLPPSFSSGRRGALSTTMMRRSRAGEALGDVKSVPAREYLQAKWMSGVSRPSTAKRVEKLSVFEYVVCLLLPSLLVVREPQLASQLAAVLSILIGYQLVSPLSRAANEIMEQLQEAGMGRGSGISQGEDNTDSESNRKESPGFQFVGVFLRFFLWLLFGLFALVRLGFNISYLLGGLGLTGLTVGIASQNVIGDIFATLSVVGDRWFAVGDKIAININNESGGGRPQAQCGIVEHIGIRSTRVRLINEGQLLIVPNSEVWRCGIQSFTDCRKRRIQVDLRVALSTPLSQLRRIPTSCRVAVESVQEVAECAGVWLMEIEEYFYRYEVVFYICGHEDLFFRWCLHKVHLALVECLDASDVSFGLNTRTFPVSCVISRQPTNQIEVSAPPTPTAEQQRRASAFPTFRAPSPLAKDHQFENRRASDLMMGYQRRRSSTGSLSEREGDEQEPGGEDVDSMGAAGSARPSAVLSPKSLRPRDAQRQSSCLSCLTPAHFTPRSSMHYSTRSRRSSLASSSRGGPLPSLPPPDADSDAAADDAARSSFSSPPTSPHPQPTPIFGEAEEGEGLAGGSPLVIRATAASPSFSEGRKRLLGEISKMGSVILDNADLSPQLRPVVLRTPHLGPSERARPLVPPLNLPSSSSSIGGGGGRGRPDNVYPPSTTSGHPYPYPHQPFPHPHYVMPPARPPLPPGAVTVGVGYPQQRRRQSIAMHEWHSVAQSRGSRGSEEHSHYDEMMPDPTATQIQLLLGHRHSAQKRRLKRH
ncbi:unnamed protein product [Vitrella brassicaformis CCMP3155]|uniref:Mechanosensitive ion channel MscS domain-containing protein n=1 Tax=Vitrella brassicaformis (strain CCMP3155) TaxID=1169540 RepID=A0A0G4F4Q9_VITBC|nr:unnamed protein product [Vitrella brassicaformis CCMP3155]|eukprot:CEM06706.1 unnamed protein product [Vitrella brassicaformis CCMP3155]